MEKIQGFFAGCDVPLLAIAKLSFFAGVRSEKYTVAKTPDKTGRLLVVTLSLMVAY
ncbi:hypothetical protein [Paenibacillus macerans]|uniref:hypothetical protein n=1 Tax=Paenibacillus macerans TaxID=44252 RepID=UPI003D3184B6